MLSGLPIGAGMGTKSSQNQTQICSKITTWFHYLKLELMKLLHPYSWLCIGIISLILLIFTLVFDLHGEEHFFEIAGFCLLHYLFYIVIQDTTRIYYNQKRELMMEKLERNTDENQQDQLRDQVAEEQLQARREEISTQALMGLVSAGLFLICYKINDWMYGK
ncbi:putative membrane protein [Wickerhamomyces ciferrii]|uniref:Membrane protein n=1 Tax=Wickerhamomyces ciferrii (strain ATCC 14091 / BCRC 22168 / CBS 111 / JCM 3599 / NBRC 0793 / NRRL Y-1031 F-60-10) TaxID=1206466 RepID=K0KMW1_WICCF|nr:uncharacterized protein BN7_2248 [Wickerhamomyces ciferrii]CCH42704.1 putative membrane protein [Wickerhamomyces ciferrii]